MASLLNKSISFISFLKSTWILKLKYSNLHYFSVNTIVLCLFVCFFGFFFVSLFFLCYVQLNFYVSIFSKEKNNNTQTEAKLHGKQTDKQLRRTNYKTHFKITTQNIIQYFYVWELGTSLPGFIQYLLCL